MCVVSTLLITFFSKCNTWILQGVSDGAAAVVIASEDALKEHKLTPLARIVAYHVSGCDPSIMGIGEGHHQCCWMLSEYYNYTDSFCTLS